MNLIVRLFFYIYSFILSLIPASTYVEGIVGQPNTFLPGQGTSQHDQTISDLIYRGLFKYDIYGSITPDLADTWSISEDGLVYTIKLKDNQYWTNGQKITADDLIYTAFNSPNLVGVGTDKVDDLTVRYILPNRYSPFLSLLSTGVMPNHSLENSNPLFGISSGKFRVVWVDKTGSLIRKVILYNQDRTDPIKRLVFRYYANQEELEIAAKLGEIDGFIGSDLESIPGFKEYTFPLQGIHYSLFFNMSDELVADQKLREEMRNVLDIENIVYNFGISVQGPLSRSVFTDQAISYDTYDKELRNDYLEKEIVLTIPDLEKHIRIADLLKEIWESRLGLNISVRRIDPSEIEDRVLKPRNFTLLLYGQEVGRDPDRYVSLHSTQSAFPGSNISGFSHVRADRALEAGRNELDNNLRITHYNVLQEVVMEQVPIIFLYHPHIRYYVNEHIRGIGEKYTFVVGDRFLDFSNWERIKTN